MGIRRSEELVSSNFRENAQGWPTGGLSTMQTPAQVATNQEFGTATPFSDLPILVRWQDGIVGDEGQNGAFIEDVLEVARQRLRYFQSRDTSRCRENALALTHIETALAWLDFRTRNRLMEKVENTYERHTQ